jgi:hypothetical protein
MRWKADGRTVGMERDGLGEDGRITFGDLTPGVLLEYSIRIDGYAPIQGSVAVKEGAVVLDDVRLDRGIDVRGRVLGPRGVPAGGARVMADTSLDTFTADDQGAFVLPHRPPGKTVIAVYADGHLPTRREVDVRPGGPPLEIVLERGALVRAVVLDERGKPVEAGRSLAIDSSESDAADLDPKVFPVGKEGRVELRLRAGRHRFRLRGPTEADAVSYGEGMFVEGETRDVVLRPEAR